MCTLCFGCGKDTGDITKEQQDSDLLVAPDVNNEEVDNASI